MWIASKHGFFSIVEAQRDSSPHDWRDTLQIRARVRGDLENLIERFDLGTSARIVETPEADYRYRVLVSRSRVADLLCKLAWELDYGNFKGEVGRLPDQRGKLPAYHRIWAEMHAVQEAAV